MANNDFDLPRPTDPVPSSSSIVANDNSKVLDYLVNGTGTVVTRTGKPLTPFGDVIDSYGFGLADFTFAEGGVLTGKNLLVLGGDFYYKYIGTGSFPLTVTAGTNPVGNVDWLATATTDAKTLNNSKITVNCIKDLTIPLVANQSFSVTGFYSGTTVGGGEFVWDATKDKSLHNGGTIITPESIAAWDGSQANLTQLLNWSGTGTGCWVRVVCGDVSVSAFGGDIQHAMNTGLSITTDSDHYISSPVELYGENSLYIKAGTSVIASNDFVGEAMFIYGDDDTLVSDIHIFGGGDINANHQCDIGVYMKRARFSSLLVGRVINAPVNGVKIGSETGVSPSYECQISNMTVWLGDVANTSQSIAVNYANATDCYATEIITRGYRRHFVTSSSSSSIEFSMCHGWNRPVNGPLLVVFDNDGSTSTFSQCYADTPTNYGDPSILEVFGWRHNGFSPQMFGCRIFINIDLTPNIGFSGIVNAVKFQRETYANIVGFKASGASGVTYKSLISGERASSTVIGLIDNGSTSIVEQSSRDEVFADGKIINFNAGTRTSKFIRCNAPQGSQFPLSWQRDGVDRYRFSMSDEIESGSNEGSDFAINSYDDSGSYLATLLQINRRFSKLQMPSGVQVGYQLEFSNSYTVATLPTSEPRGVIYVSDGDAGQPCLAVSVGGVWRRIPLGSAVSLT